MKSNTQRTAIIGLLVLIAWLVYQIGIDIQRIVLVEQGNGEDKEALETGNQHASASGKQKTILFNAG